MLGSNSTNKKRSGRHKPYHNKLRRSYHCAGTIVRK
nr:unnamed protein product [Callosobruchus chinensis]